MTATLSSVSLASMSSFPSFSSSSLEAHSHAAIPPSSNASSAASSSSYHTASSYYSAAAASASPSTSSSTFSSLLPLRLRLPSDLDASSLFARFHSDLTSRHPDTRHKSSQELRAIVESQLLHMSAAIAASFLSELTACTLQLINSSDAYEQLAALCVLDELIDMRLDGNSEILIIRAATAFRLLFARADNTEPPVMEKASKALGHLARVGLMAGGGGGGSGGGGGAGAGQAAGGSQHSAASAGAAASASGASSSTTSAASASSAASSLSTASLTLTEELVDFTVHQCFEWLQQSSSDRKLLAAVLVLRELAFNTPTLFNVHVSAFLEHVWSALWSERLEVREAAVVALRVCLHDVSMRHNRWKVQCCYALYTRAMQALGAGGKKAASPSHVHGSLLVLGELLSPSSADFLLSHFSSVAELILRYQRSHHLLIERAVIAIIPKLAALNRQQFVSLYLRDCLQWLLAECDGRNRDISYLAVGQLCMSVGEKDIEEAAVASIVQHVAAGLVPPSPVSSSSSLSSLLSSKPKPRKHPSAAALTCVGMLARALSSRLLPHLPRLIDLMLTGGLTPTLIDSLMDVTGCVPELLQDVQGRLLDSIGGILSRDVKGRVSGSSAAGGTAGGAGSAAGAPGMKSKAVVVSSSSSSSSAPSSSSLSSSPLHPPVLILALKTLSTFNFAGQDVHLLALLRDVVLLYLSVDSPLIRREAAVTIARTLSRLGSHTRGGRKGELVYFLLKRLVLVAIADPIPVIRLTVLSSLHPAVDHFLSQADVLQSLFVALNDEIFGIRELTIGLLGRLCGRNPSLIMPTLRKTLIQLLSSLQQMHSADTLEQEESSKLLSHLITACHHLIRPYVSPILRVLVPKLTELTADSRQSNGVGSYVLSTLGDLSVICGDDLLPYLDGLLPLIIATLQDRTSHIRRQVALHTLAQLLSSTGVLSPTLKYPQLMPTVLQQLKTERQPAVRLEVLKVLGIIGALDPLKYRLVLGAMEGSEREERRKSIHGSSALPPPVSAAAAAAAPLSQLPAHSPPVPLSYLKPLDPAASLAQSAKFDLTDATGIQPHEEYYPTIAIASLLRILTDPRLSQHHHMCVKAMMFIYQTLGVKCLPFLPFVLPAIFAQVRHCDAHSRDAFMQHLVGVVSIVRAHVKPYVEEMLQLCIEHWGDASLTPTILSLLEHLALSLRADFQPQLVLLMPKLVSLLQDSSSAVIIRVLHALQVMCSRGSYYADCLHVLLPCLVRLCEQYELSDSIRVESVEALATISSLHSVTDHASRLIHPFARMLVSASPALTDSIMKVLCILIQQLGYAFLVFEPMISSLVRGAEGRETVRYRALVRRLFDSVKAVRERRGLSSSGGDSMDMLLSFPLDDWKADDVAASPTVSAASQSAEEKDLLPPAIKKLQVSQPNLQKAWAASQRSTKDDWVVWMRGFSIELLKESPSSSLRACSALAQKYPPLARELFNAAFLSCWSELFESYQQDLIHSLELTFRSRNIPPDITQLLLNLAEYCEHHDKALPIDIRTLGDLAERCHAFAKALHYKEEEYSHARPSSCIEALIGINNKLQQYDAAHGVLKIAEKEGSGVEVKESWYEKLQRWEEALEAYERKEAERLKKTAEQQQKDGEETKDDTRSMSVDREEKEEEEDDADSDEQDGVDDGDEPEERKRPRRSSGARHQNGEKLVASASLQSSPLSPASLDITLGRLRCLRALGEHDRLFSLSSSLWSQTSDPAIHRLIAPLACAACCGLRQWSALPLFLSSLDDSRSPDSLFYRAIHAVHERDAERAVLFIDRCCESLDSSLTALVGESYTRAYRSIVRLQQCMELTEVLQYAAAQQSRQLDHCSSIRRMWLQRLEHCQRDVEVWQEVLMIRSLVVPPCDDQHTYLEFSSLCRKQGKLHLSLKTITSLLGVSPLLFVSQPQRSLPTDNPHVTLAAIQHLHAVGHERIAWTRLSELVLSPALAAPAPQPGALPSSSSASPAGAAVSPFPSVLSPSASSASSSSSASVAAAAGIDELSRLKSVCYLKLGQWQMSMFDKYWDSLSDEDSRAERTAAYASVIPQVLSSFHTATQLDSSSYKAWHELSMTLYRIVNHSSSSSSGSAQQQQQQADSSQQQHVVPAIHGFFRSLDLQSSAASDGSRQDVLRVLQLWFEFGHRREVEQAVLQGINTISVDTWLAVIPQLIARIHTSSSTIRNLLTELLCRIGNGHPQALVYPLTVASKSPSEARRAASLHVLHSMRQHSSVLVSQASMVSTELVRVAVLWHELWHDAIEEAYHHWFGSKSADGMFAALLPLHQAMDRGPQTSRELSFHQLYSRELQEAAEWMKKYMRGNQPAAAAAGAAAGGTAPSSASGSSAASGGRRESYMARAWELYSAVFKRMGKQSGPMTELELSEVSPKLLQARDMQLAVPGSYRVGLPVIRIAYFSPLLRVIESKQHPRRLTIGGSDGNEYLFLLKGHEDLRQDERVMQLFGLVNTLLAGDRTTAKYDLDIRRYEVIPLSPASGLIEWVPHCFHMDTQLLMADGSHRAAGDLQVDDWLLDERGHPVQVTGVQRAYQLLPPPANAVAPHQIVSTGNPLLPPQDMFRFQVVDGPDSSRTHPPLVVTAGHVMELICHCPVSVRRSAKLSISYMAVWEAFPPGHPAGAPPASLADIPALQRPPAAWLAPGPEQLRSWPYMKHLVLMPTLQRTGPAHGATRQQVETDRARCRRAAWQRDIRSPVFWSPTARDYDRFLWHCFDKYRNGRKVDANGRSVVCRPWYDLACAWGMYQPSAVSMYRGVVPPAHGQPVPPLPVQAVAHAPLPCAPVNGIPDVDQRVTPLRFTGVGRFEQLLLTQVFTAANYPGLVANPLAWRREDGAVEPRGLVLRLAWLVGFWLGDGRYNLPSIAQSDHGRRGGDHRPAIDEVLRIAEQVHAAIGSPGGAWLSGPLPPRDAGPQAVICDHTNAVQREAFLVGGLSFPVRFWTLYPATHAQAGNWFSRLLSALQLLAPNPAVGQSRKHFPPVMQADSVDVRRYLFAGFIDADGCLDSPQTHKGRQRAYCVCTELCPRVGDGFMQLARGLGYSCGSRVKRLQRRHATALQVAASDPRIDAFGYIADWVWEWIISGVPADRRQGGVDPVDVPVTMEYKQLPLAAAAPGRVRAGWIKPVVFSWPCVRTNFARSNSGGKFNICGPNSTQVAGGWTMSSNPAAGVGVAGAVRVPAVGPFRHWRLPRARSSAYVSIQVGPAGGSHRLLTAQGLVCHNCDPVHHVIKQYRDARNIMLNLEQRLMYKMAPDYERLMLIHKVEVFEYALSLTTPHALAIAKVLWLKSPNAEVWLDRRTNFTRSLAVMSMVGYVLGLGDRHTCNLMLDRHSGEIVHIDFGDCFEVAMNRDKYPEKVPFRLTRMLVAAMEVSGIEGSFRSVCERVMRVMRKNKNSVMALLEAFIYDPLVNWRLMEHRRKGAGAAAGGSGSGSGAAGGSGGSFGSGREPRGLPPPPVLMLAPAAGATLANSPPSSPPPLAPHPAADTIAETELGTGPPPVLPLQALDRRRSIVEEEKHIGDAAAADHLNEKALQVVARVESKLKGTDFIEEHAPAPGSTALTAAAGGGAAVVGAGAGGGGREHVLDVPAQVHRLIEEATSHINLCQAYIGWCPFW